MESRNPLPEPSVAVRGTVQKTFVDNIVLSGFTDNNHFRQIIGDYYDALSTADQAKIEMATEATRAFVRRLPQTPFSGTELRPIVHGYIEGIRSDPVFQAAFGQTSHRFSYVNPNHLIALQPWVEPRSDSIPTAEEDLLKFALPTDWDIPAEVSFIGPAGPIQIMSSNPAFGNLDINLDHKTGRVSIGAPKHLNLIQVVHFQGRYFLRNGYHRVSDAIRAGRLEFPAIVVDVINPGEIGINGGNFFNIGYIFGLPRPPLVGDFHTAASVRTKVRERRYGMIVGLDIKPVNIGI